MCYEEDEDPDIEQVFEIRDSYYTSQSWSMLTIEGSDFCAEN